MIGSDGGSAGSATGTMYALSMSGSHIALFGDLEVCERTPDEIALNKAARDVSRRDCWRSIYRSTEAGSKSFSPRLGMTGFAAGVDTIGLLLSLFWDLKQ